jgi:molybdate transport system ATP-binding protein
MTSITVNARIERHIVDADLEIDASSALVTVLFGPSGSGKTTILRALAGLDPLDAGRITCDGEVWNEEQRIVVPARRREIGYLFQDHALFPHLDVRANVAYGLTRQHREDKESRISSALTAAGAAHLIDRHVRDLSGGEAQRVALARSIAPGPRLLLLDEPFSSLDSPTRTRLRTDVRQMLLETGTPAIVVTHDRAEALALADQICVIVDGRIRQVGTPQQVFDRPSDPSVAAVVGVETAVLGEVTGLRDGVTDVLVRGERGVHLVAAREVVADNSQPHTIGTEVLVCIRAEDVSLSVGGEDAISSQRNRLTSRVTNITQDGPLVRVDLDAGFGLSSYITRPALEDLELAPGSIVTASFKGQSVHLIDRATQHHV